MSIRNAIKTWNRINREYIQNVLGREVSDDEVDDYREEHFECFEAGMYEEDIIDSIKKWFNITTNKELNDCLDTYVRLRNKNAYAPHLTDIHDLQREMNRYFRLRKEIEESM